MKSEKTLYLIDGTAYIYRAYHAIRSLSNSNGLPTNAIFGFTKMLIKLVEDKKPEYMAILFDSRGKTFRHEIFSEYKANRPPMPEDMAEQIPYIKKITQGFNFPMFEKSGYEADDLIGTLARQAEEQGFYVVIVSGDKDFLQLVTDKITIWDPMKDETKDFAFVQKTFELKPSDMIEVMGLSGDTSDNIPGVPGVGPKTAQSLIKTFGTIDNIYERIDELKKKKKLHQNLLANKQQALISRDLVTIDTDVPFDAPFSKKNFAAGEPDNNVLSQLFKELEFRGLQKSYRGKTDLSRKKYIAIRDSEALAKLCDMLSSQNRISIDTETTSEDPMKAALVGISFSVKPDEAFYIPCGHDYPDISDQLPMDEVLAALRPILTNPDIEKIGQNIKYDWMVLSRHNADLCAVTFDTMLASYLIDPSKRAHGLDRISLDFLDHQKITYEDTAGKGKTAKTFDKVSIETATPYACEDADITLMVADLLAKKIDEAGLSDLMQNVEVPLIPVLMRMEMKGICVDREKLLELSKSFGEQLDRLELDIYTLAGEKFNIKSSQQLGYILFEKLDLPVQKKTRKKTAYSTDVDVLTKLSEKHDLPALILRHRTVAKLKSTYTDALIDLIHPETGRIHTSYNQTVTATGRLSSSNPNLQNIPIRTEEGRQIRSAFISSPGCQLLAADYSQIELRILAHCSDDEILIDAFKNNEDIHTRTAAEVFQIFPDMITDELRRQAKVINFGIIYGMGAFSLSKELGISRKMAQTYINHYFLRYKGVKKFLDQTIETAKETKMTKTLLGRVRRLPDIASSNKNTRQGAERTATNTPIQGTAADLIKIAMIKVDEELRKQKLKSSMLLSVHDEIVFEVPENELEPVKTLVKEIMENVWDLKVPLLVNIDWGKNWTEAH